MRPRVRSVTCSVSITWLWNGTIGSSGSSSRVKAFVATTTRRATTRPSGVVTVVAVGRFRRELQNREPRVELDPAAQRAVEQPAGVAVRVVAAVLGQEARAKARREAELGPDALRRPELDARAVRLDERRLLEEPALQALVVREEEPARRAEVAVDRLGLDELAQAPPVAERQAQAPRKPAALPARGSRRATPPAASA